MKSRSNGSGATGRWIDTLPTGTDASTLDGASASANSSEAQRQRRRDGASPEQTPRSSRKSPRKLSVWHRPLSQVLSQAGIKIAIAAGELALAALSARKSHEPSGKALAVVGSAAPPDKRDDVARSGVLGAVVSASRACVAWLSPPPVKVAPGTSTGASRPRVAPKPAPFAPAVGSRRVAEPDESASMTRPANVKIESFTQQLFAEADRSLNYDPRGMGRLWAAEGPAQSSAGPQAKWYFLAVLKRFEELGETMNRYNPKYVAMTKSFTDTLLNHAPSDPIWDEIVRDDPRHVARCFAGLDKPQHLVVDIEPSSIRRVENHREAVATV